MNAKSYAILPSLDVVLEHLDDNDWVAVVEQLGIVVYGDSFEAAVQSVDQAFDFIMETFRKRSDIDTFRRYLDNHGIQYTITPFTERTESVVQQKCTFEKERVFAHA